MQPNDVAQYLKAHPEFFEQYADLLADIFIPHPHGGHAISITERQILTLREKGRLLESKLAELLQFGEENDAIGEKVHRLGTALIDAANRDQALERFAYNLTEDFAVPHVAVRVWGVDAGASERSEQPSPFVALAIGSTGAWDGAAADWCELARGRHAVVALDDDEKPDARETTDALAERMAEDLAVVAASVSCVVPRVEGARVKDWGEALEAVLM
jgi:hypothetical protein